MIFLLLRTTEKLLHIVFKGGEMFKKFAEEGFSDNPLQVLFIKDSLTFSLSLSLTFSAVSAAVNI